MFLFIYFFIEYKLSQVDVYRQRWKNRQRCKQIAHDYSLVKQATTLGILSTHIGTPKKTVPQQTKKQRKLSKEEK